MKQLAYLCAFIAVMSFVEIVLYSHGEIKYYNGWNLWWSILLYVGVFPLLRLHYKNPIWAWVILFALVAGGVFHFKIPLADL